MKGRFPALRACLFSLVVFTGCTTVSSLRFEPEKDFTRKGENLSPEEENTLGRAVAARILASFKPAPSSALNGYLDEIGYTLAGASNRPDTFAGYAFTVIDSKEINAVSAPGGFVFVSRGLLDRARDEDALAAVLAHEIAHVVLKHGLESVKPEHTGTFSRMAGKAVCALDCSGLGSQLAAAFAGAVDDIVEKLLKTGYSTDQEYAADAMAVEILKRAGYTEDSLARMLKTLETLRMTGGWFSTHPSPQDRIRKLTALAAESEKLGFPDRQIRFKKRKGS